MDADATEVIVQKSEKIQRDAMAFSKMADERTAVSVAPKGQVRVRGVVVNCSWREEPENGITPVEIAATGGFRWGLSDVVETSAGLMWNPEKWPIGMRCGMVMPSQGDGMRRIVTGLPPMTVLDPPGAPPREPEDDKVNDEAVTKVARALLELARHQLDQGRATDTPTAPTAKGPYCAGSERPPVGDTVAVRTGVCQVCRQRLHVRVDGAVRKHRPGRQA